MDSRTLVVGQARVAGLHLALIHHQVVAHTRSLHQPLESRIWPRTRAPVVVRASSALPAASEVGTLDPHEDGQLHQHHQHKNERDADARDGARSLCRGGLRGQDWSPLACRPRRCGPRSVLVRGRNSPAIQVLLTAAPGAVGAVAPWVPADVPSVAAESWWSSRSGRSVVLAVELSRPQSRWPWRSRRRPASRHLPGPGRIACRLGGSFSVRLLFAAGRRRERPDRRGYEQLDALPSRRHGCLPPTW